LEGAKHAEFGSKTVVIMVVRPDVLSLRGGIAGHAAGRMSIEFPGDL